MFERKNLNASKIIVNDWFIIQILIFFINRYQWTFSISKSYSMYNINANVFVKNTYVLITKNIH